MNRIESVPEVQPTVPYAGLATRAVALVIDAALVTASFWLLTAVMALIVSLFSSLDIQGVGAIAGALGGWSFYVGAYFVIGWTLGATLGMRLMRIHVMTAHGKALRPRRALVRFLAFVAGAVPLFAGYLLVLVQPRRRAFHDLMAGTLVVYAGQEAAALTSRGEPAAAATAAAISPTRPQSQ